MVFIIGEHFALVAALECVDDLGAPGERGDLLPRRAVRLIGAEGRIICMCPVYLVQAIFALKYAVHIALIRCARTLDVALSGVGSRRSERGGAHDAFCRCRIIIRAMIGAY
jgi:hypothetical protein